MFKNNDLGKRCLTLVLVLCVTLLMGAVASADPVAPAAPASGMGEMGTQAGAAGTGMGEMGTMTAPDTAGAAGAQNADPVADAMPGMSEPAAADMSGMGGTEAGNASMAAANGEGAAMDGMSGESAGTDMSAMDGMGTTEVPVTTDTAPNPVKYEFSFLNILTSLVHMIYYVFLLAAAGITLYSMRARGEDGRPRNLIYQGLLLLALVDLFLKYMGLGLGVDGILRRLQTPMGMEEMAILVLAIIGLFIGRANGIFKFLWACLILGMESGVGHTSFNEIPSGAHWLMFVDFIHLVAAALVLAGILLMLSRKRSAYSNWGAPMYGRVIIISLLVMIVTGLVMTGVFTKFSYLLATDWGILVLVAMVLAVILLIFAFTVTGKRRSLETKSTRLAIMLLITVLALTTISAMTTIDEQRPQNVAINYHKMGDTLHVTLRNLNNVADTPTTFTLKVWLPSTVGNGEPAEVAVRLFPRGTTDEGASYNLDLVQVESDPHVPFEGFVNTNYEGTITYSAGSWTAEITITNADGETTVLTKDFDTY